MPRGSVEGQDETRERFVDDAAGGKLAAGGVCRVGVDDGFRSGPQGVVPMGHAGGEMLGQLFTVWSVGGDADLRFTCLVPLGGVRRRAT